MTARPFSASPRSWLSRLSTAVAASALLGLAGCTGATVPWTFEGEPVCADFKVGASSETQRGGLKKPIRATFTKGSDVIARVVIYGLRQQGDPATPLLLPDADAEYDVEWAECENDRAPVVVSKNKPFDTKYECGEAKPYTTVKVQTKSGQSPRKLPVTLPPAAPCWAADKAAAPSPPASAEAVPAPAPVPDPSTSAAPSASAASAASAAPSPSAAPSASAAPKASASAK